MILHWWCLLCHNWFRMTLYPGTGGVCCVIAGSDDLSFRYWRCLLCHSLFRMRFISRYWRCLLCHSWFRMRRISGTGGVCCVITGSGIYRYQVIVWCLLCHNWFRIKTPLSGTGGVCCVIAGSEMLPSGTGGVCCVIAGSGDTYTF